jgi:hypothetical protein
VASCAPNDLAAAVACFCLSDKQQLAVQTYLLATIAGGSMSPSVLNAAAVAAGFGNLPEKQSLQIQAYLLCAILNNAGG